MTRVEGVVIHRNRKPIVVRLKKGQTFFTLNDKEYHIDPDATVFGSWKPPYFFRLVTADCNRYYFAETFAKPINLYRLMDEAGEGFEKDEAPTITDHSMCVKPRELAQIFKPRFYQIISRVKDTKSDIILYASLAGAGFSLYAVWQISALKALVTKLIEHLGLA